MYCCTNGLVSINMGRFKSGGGRGSEGDLCANGQYIAGTIKILFHLHFP